MQNICVKLYSMSKCCMLTKSKDLFKTKMATPVANMHVPLKEKEG